jgi:hypothetical protein
MVEKDLGHALLGKLDRFVIIFGSLFSHLEMKALD